MYVVSIRSKSTRLVPATGRTLPLFLPRPLCLRLLLSPFSTCRRPPRFDETVLARAENGTVLYAWSIRLDMYQPPVDTYLIADMNRTDRLLSVRARKPNGLTHIK